MISHCDEGALIYRNYLRPCHSFGVILSAALCHRVWLLFVSMPTIHFVNGKDRIVLPQAPVVTVQQMVAEIAEVLVSINSNADKVGDLELAVYNHQNWTPLQDKEATLESLNLSENSIIGYSFDSKFSFEPLRDYNELPEDLC